MAKRLRNTGNFLFSFAINLIANFELGVLGLIILVLHFILPDKIPLFIPLLILGGWVALFFVITLVLTLLVTDVPTGETSAGRTNRPTSKYSSSGQYAYRSDKQFEYENNQKNEQSNEK